LLLAEACRKNGKAAEAETALAKIANPPDSDVRWHSERGLVFKVLGKTGDARSAFEKVLALDSSNLAAAAELVGLDVLAKDYESALRRAEEQRELHPKSALPHVLRATVLAPQSKFKEAEEDLKTAVGIESGMIAAYELLVRIYASTGRMAEAVGQLERARKIDPANIPVLMTLGSLYQGTGRKAEARECYEKVLEKDTDFVPALNNLAVILGESSAEDLDRARRLALSARSSKPDDGSIADTLGWIFFKQGDFKRAQGLLGEAVAKLPDDRLIKFHYGMACRAMADEPAARDAFRQATAAQSDFPGRIEAIEHLARLEATIEPGEAGIRVLEEQVARDPSDVISRLRLGGLFEAEGRHQQAADAYAGAMKVNGELHRAVSRLAHLYAGPLNDAEKAYEYARKTRDLDPGDAQAAAIMGALAYRAREFERADLMFRESLSTIKDDTGLMMQGAWAAYSVGRLDDARKLMETVIVRSKDPKELAGGKRFLEIQQEDCPAGVIADALQSDPEYVPALMARAARAERENQAAAVEDYEKVLEVFPKFAPAVQAIKRIQSKKAPES
jgi:tetratricopeptide (TPR) repeat protein